LICSAAARKWSDTRFIGLDQTYIFPMRKRSVCQYLILREYRRKGLGQAGIRLLMEQRFKPGQTVIIDVLDSNLPGRRFWAKVGFAPYSITMKTKNNA